MLPWLFSLLSYDLGIDLGTANTLVYVKGKGIMVREPSVVTRHRRTKQVLAIGTDAKKMLGKAPQTIEVIRPLRDGVISDFDATGAMLAHYIKYVHEPTRRAFLPRVPRPKVVIGIPSGVTDVERRAVHEAAILAGARQAFLVEEPIAAAVGADLPIEESGGSMICDIGGGTTEIAVLSMSSVVAKHSIRVGGDEIDEAIAQHLRLKHALLIGEKSAEDVKLAIGSAFPVGAADRQTVVRGRSLETGLPQSIRLKESEIRESIVPVIQHIVEAIGDVIEQTPAEFMNDIIERGLVITGGGSLLPGMDKLIATELKLPVWIAEDPLTTVVRGCGKLLDRHDLLTTLAS